MNRVTSGTTLNALVNDLSDTQLGRAQRAERVRAHLDAFIGIDDNASECIARAQRVLTRDLALPHNWNHMRTAVAKTLVADASQRSASMGQAADIATRENYEVGLKEEYHALIKNDPSIPDVFRPAVEAASMDAVDGACVTQQMAFAFATRVPESCLAQATGTKFSFSAELQRHVAAAWAELRTKVERGETIDEPSTEADDVTWAEGEALVQAANPTAAADWPEPYRKPALRALGAIVIEHTTTAERRAMTALTSSDCGDKIKAVEAATMDKLTEVINADASARFQEGMGR